MLVPKDLVLANWKIGLTRRVPTNFHEMLSVSDLDRRGEEEEEAEKRRVASI